VVQTARFDRHLVRDLTWSRHQLEDLARRRLEVQISSSKGDTNDRAIVTP